MKNACIAHPTVFAFVFFFLFISFCISHFGKRPSLIFKFLTISLTYLAVKSYLPSLQSVFDAYVLFKNRNVIMWASTPLAVLTPKKGHVAYSAVTMEAFRFSVTFMCVSMLKFPVEFKVLLFCCIVYYQVYISQSFVFMCALVFVYFDIRLLPSALNE